MIAIDVRTSLEVAWGPEQQSGRETVGPEAGSGAGSEAGGGEGGRPHGQAILEGGGLGLDAGAAVRSSKTSAERVDNTPSAGLHALRQVES